MINLEERARRDLAMNSIITYFFKLDHFIIDATVFGNASRFVNHTCRNANALFRKAAYETPNCDERHIVLRSTRRIKKNEEILADYDPRTSGFFGKQCICAWH